MYASLTLVNDGHLQQSNSPCKLQLQPALAFSCADRMRASIIGWSGTQLSNAAHHHDGVNLI